MDSLHIKAFSCKIKKIKNDTHFFLDLNIAEKNEQLSKMLKYLQFGSVDGKFMTI
jgi:hypothetical protein